MSLYLASQSPRRRELLRQIGVRFQLLASEVDESVRPGEDPEDYVARMAAEKAAAGAALLGDHNGQHWVLGADTAVVLDGEIMGKPADEEHAREMLERLSGRTHRVISAVSLAGVGRQATRTSVTEVSFRELSPDLIDCYWHTREPHDKAGAYAIQGLGAVFVNKIVGSYSGVVGLPLEILVPLLDEFGVPYWRNREEPHRRE
ncbi:Maf family protein [Gilvimarinus sp. F26214L]|uniref:Maf family protein n=1 Tax=Gilvimarinus sp. DZF01 TaxID=3461371 RepID=UPI0040451F73